MNSEVMKLSDDGDFFAKDLLGKLPMPLQDSEFSSDLLFDFFNEPGMEIEPEQKKIPTTDTPEELDTRLFSIFIDEISGQRGVLQNQNPKSVRTLKSERDNIRKNARFAYFKEIWDPFFQQHGLNREKIRGWTSKKYQRDLKFVFFVFAIVLQSGRSRQFLQFYQTNLKKLQANELLHKSLQELFKVGKLFLERQFRRALKLGYYKESPREECGKLLRQSFPGLFQASA